MQNDKPSQDLIRSIIREILEKPEIEKKYEVESLVSENDLAIKNMKYYAGSISNLTVVYSVSGLEKYVEDYREGGPEKLLASLKSVVSGREPIRSVISGVHWGKPYKQTGRCNDAAVVRRSASRIKGYGTKAYIAALSIHGELAPDRNIVKKDAEKVWNRIASGGAGVDVTRNEFDDIDRRATPPESDDCKIYPGSAILNASYELHSGIPSDISKMQSNGKRQFSDISAGPEGGELVANLQKCLQIEFDLIFRKMYEEKNF